ncbi:MAG: enoyl-CoA hydratase/isomerase family protein [Saprospiraceae bacterium]|nr:enoyl-CoA hydratase/isomerase family protein [Saprospiraceae bacterium]
MQTIQLQHYDFYTVLTFNRAEVHNAFNAQMIEEITEVIRGITAHESTRVLVIRGAGKSFSAGADLKYMQALANYSEAENVADSKRLFDLFDSIYCCAIPVVSVVHGAAFGGANGIIAASDYAIASQSAKFAFSEVKLGILPATISPFVLHKIGQAAARDLLLSGRRFSGEEAQRLGLVNEAVAEEALEEQLQAYLNHFKSASPDAVQKTKKMIRQLANDQVLDIREYTAHLIAEARASHAGKEGIAAFFEKRKPNWNDK